VTKPSRVVLVNEFSDTNCPVTNLVYDLGFSLEKHQHTHVIQLNLRTKYRPGGTRWQRVASFFLMQILMPFAVLYHFLAATARGQCLCFVVTTLPPLIHWVTILLGKVIGFRVVVWYQDAHPEIEARILRKNGFGFFAKGLVACDRWVLSMAPAIVVLDDAMADLLRLNRAVASHQIFIAPPWTTFINPPKPIRETIYDSARSFRLLYAGNYGFAHDLLPLADAIRNLPDEIRTRLSVTGVGMSENSRRVFTKIFEDAGIKIETVPRQGSMAALLKMFNDFDFGVVSLRQEYAGIASPSKAFTYLSQGLPILYEGPQRTLPDRLVNDGAGYTTVQFIDALKAGCFDPLKMAGLIMPDPKAESEKILIKAIYES
jgi:hypothetical protein